MPFFLLQIQRWLTWVQTWTSAVTILMATRDLHLIELVRQTEIALLILQPREIKSAALGIAIFGTLKVDLALGTDLWVPEQE
jgi:hypothetical protein